MHNVDNSMHYEGYYQTVLSVLPINSLVVPAPFQ
jgi:hypothetical protein